MTLTRQTSQVPSSSSEERSFGYSVGHRGDPKSDDPFKLSQVNSPALQRSPLRRSFNLLLWTAAFLGTATVSALVGAGAALLLPLPQSVAFHRPSLGIGDLWRAGFRYQVTRPINILVMGIDEVLDAPAQSKAAFGGRTDTLLLVRINPQDNTLDVMSIPRDTRVQIPGYGMAKINQANVEGGPELVAQTIADNLGNVEIDRYLRVNTTAFREIVDLIGGIEIYVPKRMEYNDNTQGLHIDLYPGWQTLNGDQAEQFARFRKDNKGDIGRVQRQQMLLKAFRDRLTNPTVIPKLPQAIRVALRYVDTNLTPEEMLALANFGLAIEPEKLQMVMLPGRFSQPSEFQASDRFPDWNAGAGILQNFFQTDGVGIYADNSGHGSGLSSQIAVQNASGDKGAAKSVADYLRSSGFHNVYVIEDWPDTLKRTEIIAQKGDMDSARAIGTVVGLGQVLSESTGHLESDITLRVGQDWSDSQP